MIFENRACANFRDGEAFLRAVIDALPHEIAVLDRKGFVVAANERWLKSEGSGGLIGERIAASANLFDAVREVGRAGNEQARRMADGLEAVLAGASVEFEIEYSSGEGESRRWYLMRVEIAPFERGGAVLSRSEITARRDAEESARRHELHLRLALEASFAVSFEWNIQRDEIRRFVSICGALPATADNAPDDLAAVCQKVVPDDRELFVANVRRAIESESGVYESEFRVALPDGDMIWLSEKGRLERDATGRPLRLIGLSQDVTDRKCVEESLRQSEANLRRQRDELDWIYQNAPIGLCVLDLDLRYLRVNEWLAELHGVPVNAHIGRAIEDIVPNLAAQARKIARQILEKKESVQDVECSGETPARFGVERFFNTSWRPLFDAEGEIISFGVVVEETTERKRIERALREHAARDAFVVNLGDRLRSLTDAFEIQEAACRLLGEHLDADRVYFGDIYEDQDLAIVRPDYSKEGLHSISGQYRLTKFPGALSPLAAGRPFVIHDTSESMAASMEGYRALGIGALACTPLLADGKLVWTLNVVSLRKRQWSDEEIGLIADVAKRAWDAVKRALVEAALRDSEQRERRRSAELQAVLDMAPIGLAIAFDPTGEHISGNPACGQIFGVAGGSEFSKTGRRPPAFNIFQGGRELMAGELPMQRAVRGEAVGGEIINIRQESGEWLTAFAKAMPLYDESGNPRGAVGAFVDITKIKRAEDALRESEERFRSLVESYAQAVWEADADGVVVKDSPSWRAYTGQSLDELLCDGWITAIHPDDRSCVQRRWREALETRCDLDAEFRLRHKGDGWRWTNVRATPIRASDGSVVKWTGMNIDIDARKRAETALQESEAEFRATFELTGVGITQTNPATGEFINVNPTFAKMLGYERSELIGRRFSEFTHPDDRVADWERFARMARGETKVYDNEKRYLRKDGTSFWIRANATLIGAPDGPATRTVAMIQDISEQKHIEHELRESETRLKLAVDAGKIGIFDWRLDADELIWDDRMRVQWGLRPDAPTSFDVFMQGVHQDDRAKVRQIIDRSLDPDSGGVYEIEYRVIGIEDQTERWISASGRVFFENGRAVRFVGTTKDITSHKRMDAERQKFVSLAEQSVEFIGICGMAFEPLYVNPAGLRLVGLESMEEAVSGRVQVGDFFFPEDHAFLFHEFFPHVMQEGNGSVEIRFRHFSTGEAIWMLYNVFFLRDPDGETIGFATVSRDITARKRTEDALKDADRRKDEFLATLAHELRNPLAPIRNAVHVLRHDGIATIKEKRDFNLLAMIERQVEHLIRLVDDLLEVSRITRGKIELKKAKVDLVDVLSHALEMAQPMIERGGHLLHVEMPPEPIFVDGDSVRLAQVFTNLLNNAAKYTEHGGAIMLWAERRGDEAVVSVRDSGLGIPAEMLPRVFDLFTQVDRTLGRAQGGLGIGLALVRSLLQLHGGSVEAQSEGLGRGSAFIVRLPAFDAKEREEAMAPPLPIESTSRRVLVIDDDHDVADSLVMFLETFGAEVRVAYGGAEGVESVKAFQPDIVFLDLGMPQMDGYETARRIRALPEGRSLTLVALTGWGQDQIHDRVRDCGFNRQLTKPAGLEALQDVLANG